MKLFLSAIILVLVFEGSLFAAFPEQMRICLEEGGRTPKQTLRKMGIFCLLLAIILSIVLLYAKA